MAKKILVALNSQDRLDQMLPYIEEIAQPGMEVVLLIRFAPNALAKEPRDQWVTLKPLEEIRFGKDVEEPAFATGNIDDRRLLQDQKLLAEHKVFLALEALLKKGVEIAVDVYTGSLRRAVRTYTRRGNVHLIMQRAGSIFSMIHYLWTFPILDWFKQASSSPVLLVHPKQAL